MMVVTDELLNVYRFIIEDAPNRQRTARPEEQWSLQGFGMFRLYVNPTVRLHVWSAAHRVPAVSDVHTHPWDFTSTILAGAMLNQKFIEHWRSGAKYMKSLLRCGKGGGLEGEAVETNLSMVEQTRYHEGCDYSMFHDEIHVSTPEHGTVTLVERKFLPETEHAYVYWQRDHRWVSAEPRIATVEEVEEMRDAAMRRFA